MMSSALHDVEFVGPLRHWSTFPRAVEATGASQNWSNRVIKYTQKSYDIDVETVYVGGEHGVQGRFQQLLGQGLGQVLDAQSIDLHFADFKRLSSPYSNTPDAVIMAGNNELNVVENSKFPGWRSI